MEACALGHSVDSPRSNRRVPGCLACLACSVTNPLPDILAQVVIPHHFLNADLGADRRHRGRVYGLY